MLAGEAARSLPSRRGRHPGQASRGRSRRPLLLWAARCRLYQDHSPLPFAHPGRRLLHRHVRRGGRRRGMRGTTEARPSAGSQVSRRGSWVFILESVRQVEPSYDGAPFGLPAQRPSTGSACGPSEATNSGPSIVTTSGAWGTPSSPRPRPSRGRWSPRTRCRRSSAPGGAGTPCRHLASRTCRPDRAAHPRPSRRRP